MTLDKGKVIEETNQGRYERDLKLITEYKQKKLDELAKIKANRGDADAKFMGMGDLQALINEANKYKDEIEDMHVELQHLSIKIKELEDGTEFLQERKEELDEQKKATDEQNEELEKQLKAKEEANQKRLIAKLQRDKNPEIKDLIAKEEQQTENNEDFNNKFREEKEKLDQLQDELVQLKENMRLMTEKLDETTKATGDQDAELKELRETIDEK